MKGSTAVVLVLSVGKCYDFSAGYSRLFCAIAFKRKPSKDNKFYFTVELIRH